MRWWLYKLSQDTPIVEEIRKVLTYSFFWFLIYIGFVYLTTGFLTTREIPRLIIIYSYVFATSLSIVIRYIIHLIYRRLYSEDRVQKEILLVIGELNPDQNILSDAYYEYRECSWEDNALIETLIREKRVSKIIYMGEQCDMWPVFGLSRVYGIPFLYPKISQYIPLRSAQEVWVAWTPMVELSPISITAWGRILKRAVDIVFSSIALVVLSPVLLLTAIWVYISDRTGPIIYRNQRIGQDGKIFSLYKFRYMYWRDSTKEAYNIDDGAIELEEKLKKEKNTRDWPLYKIKDDPRVMPFGKIIEQLSIDELPQLYNVLIGNMSLIWPRPHQPREIALYDETDKQVLTVKPGITGMAQVYGRDANTFKEEVALDTYYIENYSLSLDVAIFLRTILVVITRAFMKEKLEKGKK